MSVEFDFNTPLNDVVPLCPILLTVVFMRMEEWIVDGYHECAICFVFTSQIECCECCV